MSPEERLAKAAKIVLENEPPVRNYVQASAIFSEITGRATLVHAETAEALGWLAEEMRGQALDIERMWDALHVALKGDAS
jgi:hypothetical protein